MTQLLAACLLFLALVFNGAFVLAGTPVNELPECVVVTHCVREDWEVSDLEGSFKKVAEAVANTPRTKIVEQSDSYIHAEAKTKWRRYTDDLLVKALPDQSIIQVRSESRVGVGDNGVNKQRINELAYRLTTNQINYTNPNLSN